MTASTLDRSSTSQAADPADGWIDAHAHIWTRDVETYPLAAGQTVESLAPASFTAEQLLEAARAENVTRVVLICHHPYYGFDNSYLLDTAAKYPGVFRIVGALDETRPHPEERMRELAKHHVTGFRISPSVSGANWLDSPAMQTMWRTAVETGQAMCCLMEADQLPRVEKMCRKHPETPVVLDHFALVGASGEIHAQDLDNLCRLAELRRVYVKVSAFYALGEKKPPYLDLVPMIKRLVDSFGPQRLMWASDAPYQNQAPHTYHASVALIRDHLDFLSADDREWLLAKTAEKVFFAG